MILCISKFKKLSNKMAVCGKFFLLFQRGIGKMFHGVA